MSEFRSRYAYKRKHDVFEPPQSAPSIIFLLFIEQSHSRIAESVSVEYLKGRVTTVTVWLVKAPNSSQSWDDERINEPGAH